MRTNKRYHSKTLLTRLAALLTAALITVSILPAASFIAFAQTSTVTYDGEFGYVIDVADGKFTASVCEFKPDDLTLESYTIKIPDKVGPNEYPVTSITANAFSNFSGRTRITGVTLPNSVTSIGDSAFRDCTGLKTVTLSTDLTKMGAYAFAGCSALEDIKIPDKLTEISYSAFYNCTSLKSVTFSKSLTYIGQSAFSNCTSLEKADIPDTVTGIGSGAFEGCSKLSSLKLPKNLGSIDDYTFHNCSSLAILTLPDSIKAIGLSAFADCTSITTVSIPETVQTIATMAFAGCTSLTAVIIPYTVQNISESAFYRTPAEIWGYSGSYADSYAYRNNIRFHTTGYIRRVTFSADNRYATVNNNIAIRSSKGVLVIPPADVTSGEILTINITAPTGYDINYITINDISFANGSSYTVSDSDVNIFVSYKQKEAITTTTAAVTEVTTVQPVQTPAASTSVTVPSDATTVPISTVPQDEDAPIRPNDDDDDDEDEDEDTTAAATVDDGNNENSFVKVDSDLEDINGEKVRIITKRENFIGPATVRITNTPEAYDAAKDASEALANDNVMYYAFDISLYDENGKENQGVMARGTITFQIPVPDELLPYIDGLSVYHIVDGTPELIRSSVIEDASGIKRIQFESNSFSPYMIVADLDETIPVIDDEETTRPADQTGNDDDDGDEEPGAVVTPPQTTAPDAQIVDDGGRQTGTTPRPSYNGNINPHTGAIVAGTSVSVIALMCIPLVRSRKKRKRTKTPVE